MNLVNKAAGRGNPYKTGAGTNACRAALTSVASAISRSISWMRTAGEELDLFGVRLHGVAEYVWLWSSSPGYLLDDLSLLEHPSFDHLIYRVQRAARLLICGGRGRNCSTKASVPPRFLYLM